MTPLRPRPQLAHRPLPGVWTAGQPACGRACSLARSGSSSSALAAAVPQSPRWLADRLVTPGLVFLPVGGQEQPGRFPLPPPLLLGEPGGGKVVPRAQQGLPATDHGRRPRLQLPLYSGQPGLQRPQADGLGMPLGRGGIPAGPPCPTAPPDREPRPAPADAGLQAGPPSAQVLPGPPELVFAGPGDRARPPRRPSRRHRPPPP